MATQLKNRTVAPDGGAIQRLRIQKGWRVEDLAKKTRCSLKTVENVERGANVYLYTLSKFAQALGVEVSTLMTGSVPDEPSSRERRLKVQITLDIPFEQFDEPVQLVHFLTRLQEILCTRNEILVAGVEEGSTILTLEMTLNDIEDLILHFGPDLDELRIEKLQLPDNKEFTLTYRGIPPLEGVSFGEPLRGRLLTRVVPQDTSIGPKPIHHPEIGPHKPFPPPEPDPRLNLDEETRHRMGFDLDVPSPPEHEPLEHESDE